MSPVKKQSASDKKQKQILMPIIIGLLLAAGVGYFMYYCFGILKTTRAVLAEADRRASAINKMQELKLKEEELLKVFPRIQKRSDIIEEVVGWARKEGLEITEIEPKETNLSGTNFKQLELTLNGKGTYIPITRFLKRVEAAPYFVLASGVELQGHDLRGSGMRSRYARRSTFDTDDSTKQFKVTVHVFLLQ